MSVRVRRRKPWLITGPVLISIILAACSSTAYNAGDTAPVHQASTTCTPGLDTAGTADLGSFYPLTGLPTGLSNTSDAYQVTFTNTSSIDDVVSSFTVAFYSSSGQELGTDSEEPPSGQDIITPNQSFTYTEIPYNSSVSYAAGISGAVDSGITCQVIGWVA